MVLKGETYLIKLQMHLQRKINRMSIALGTSLLWDFILYKYNYCKNNKTVNEAY